MSMISKPLEFRPTFVNLVAAEEELGPMFALVERAAAGQLTLLELVALFWHCRTDITITDRIAFSEELTGQGLAALAVPLRALLRVILQGVAPCP